MSSSLTSQSGQARRHLRGTLAVGFLIAFPIAINACSASTTDGSNTDDTTSGGSHSGGQTSGGSQPTSGGSPSSGGAHASGGSAAIGGALGGGGQGGAGSAVACSLPFEAGDCEASIPVYAHNPQTGRCEPEVYGGCGGNANRFATYLECVQSCSVHESGMACEVDGITYPDGFASVPDPFSCNSCECIDGDVNGCTQGGCTQDCPAGTAPGTTCAACGPTDACLVLKTGCLPECDPADAVPCPAGGVCLNGLCGSPCG